ncbi:hypothetical protein DFH06DRAFT_1363139 [Mycena polygramma]|nr:hypothetical protein DFH06DRAFT_1363139 [Mycena polygramma]
MANTSTALVGQGSSHLFQNAAGFDIVGGQFVLGDVHNHAGPGPAHTSTSSDTSTEALSDSEIYYRQMLYQKRGFPLYVPGPEISHPAEYQQRGVAIGDVGRVTPEGVFDFFFNIFLAPDDPIHVNRTPEGFSPLALYDPVDLLHENHAPGDFVSSSNAQKLDLDTLSDVFLGGDFGFGCDALQGAVLALPDGALLQKLTNVENMRTYAAEHADSWYKYINGARGRGISNGDLYLVTGCEKAQSWGMASFRAARHEFRIFFKPTIIPGSAYNPYSWSGLHGQRNPSRRKCHNPHSTNDPANQTTFVHGFSIFLPTGVWGKLFGTVQTSSIVDFQSLLNAPSSSSGSGPHGSLFSWAFDLLSGRGAKGGKQRAGERRGAVLSDLSPTAMVLNPARLINEYILYKAPQATGVVLSHDDDWCSILGDDHDLRPLDFFHRIDDRFTITEQTGGHQKPRLLSAPDLISHTVNISRIKCGAGAAWKSKDIQCSGPNPDFSTLDVTGKREV